MSHNAETDAVHEVRRAMRALYTTVPAGVARDAAERVESALTQAWDEGMEWGRSNHLAPGNGPRGYAANPYRVFPPAKPTTEEPR